MTKARLRPQIAADAAAMCEPAAVAYQRVENRELAVSSW
jgi:hypothetical protein